MKKLVVLFLLSMLGFASNGTNAQDFYGSPSGGELPPQMIFSEQDGEAALERMMLPPEENYPAPGENYPQDILEPISTPQELRNQNSISSGLVRDEMRIMDAEPAILESTGTWLRRGFWFAEADAVIFARSFNRNGVVLAFDADTIRPPFQREGIKNTLTIDGGKPGAEGLPRLNVGRFLFRDCENRDHTVEFTIFGGGNWSQEQRLDGGNLVMPPDIDNFNPSFSGAESMQFAYDSWFNSFELNYNVKQRMLKDRMELEPSGHWVRRAQPTKSWGLLAGLRYFNLDEDLKISAFNINNANSGAVNATGDYHVQTGNHLIGTQLGASSSYDTARWSIMGRVKGGMYLNMIDLDSNFSVSENVTSGSTDLQEDNLAWIGEAALIGKWHIRPNFSLRTSLEVMHLSGVSLAPFQVDFIQSGSPKLLMNSDVVYLGGAIGFESYW